MIPKISKAFQVLIIIFISFALCLPLIIVLVFQTFYGHKIYPKIKVLDLKVDGLTKKKALNLLKNKIKEQNFNSLFISYQDKVWEINLNDLNLHYLPQKTIEKAYLFGRSKDLKNNLVSKWQAWQNQINLNLDYQYNNSLYQEKMATISALINIPAIPTSIEVSNNGIKEIIINPGQQGKQVDDKKLASLVNQRLTQLDKKPINLPVIELSSQASLDQIEKTKQRAEKLLDKKVDLVFNNQQWQLLDREMISFLNFQNNLNQEKISLYANELAKSIDRPAQNALFNFVPADGQNNKGRVTEFKPAQDGQELDRPVLEKLLIKAITGLENKDNKTAKISLPINITKPDVQTKDANNLGINKLIGRGESWFQGSLASRVHNLNLAAQKLNGHLIAPGEIFSFNRAVGDISAQTGFQQAYIIKEGRTILGDGGGVCQTSTTLFRAALNAGLAIEERKAHAYRVSYYEQNHQVGIDATVFSPTVDLKFKNDTPAYILIQSLIDLKNSRLAFHLYGTWDGREAVVSSSRIWELVPPPPDLYQDDSSLAMGTIKQVDWKAWGAKAAFDWKVVRGQEILQEKTFYSYYKPWQAIYLRGTSGG